MYEMSENWDTKVTSSNCTFVCQAVRNSKMFQLQQLYEQQTQQILKIMKLETANICCSCSVKDLNYEFIFKNVVN